MCSCLTRVRVAPHLQLFWGNTQDLLGESDGGGEVLSKVGKPSNGSGGSSIGGGKHPTLTHLFPGHCPKHEDGLKRKLLLELVQPALLLRRELRWMLLRRFAISRSSHLLEQRYVLPSCHDHLFCFRMTEGRINQQHGYHAQGRSGAQYQTANSLEELQQSSTGGGERARTFLPPRMHFHNDQLCVRRCHVFHEARHVSRRSVRCFRRGKIPHLHSRWFDETRLSLSCLLSVVCVFSHVHESTKSPLPKSRRWPLPLDAFTYPCHT